MLSSSTMTRNQESIPLIFTSTFTLQNARKTRPVSTTQKRAGPNNVVMEHIMGPNHYKAQNCQLLVKLQIQNFAILNLSYAMHHTADIFLFLLSQFFEIRSVSCSQSGPYGPPGDHTRLLRGHRRMTEN
jgi:hypothetical protein